MVFQVPGTVTAPVAFLDELETIDFDIYVQVGNRDVLYCRHDDIQIKERISKLKAKKGLNFFKVKSDDYSKFLSYIQRGLDTLYQDQPEEKMPQQIQDIFEQQFFLVDKFLTRLTSKELYHLVRSTCGPFYVFFSSKPKALELLYQLPVREDPKDKVITHMIRVAALSSHLIAQTKNDPPGKPVYEMIMGAMVHDLSYIHHNWDFKATPKDSEVYKNHPFQSEKLAQESGHFDPWAVDVILKHEEHIDGSGFPSGFREEDLDPCILCIGAVNAFDRMITLQGQPGAQTLKQILIDKMGAYPLPMLQTLQKIVKACKIA